MQAQLKQEQSRSNDTEMYYQEKIQDLKEEMDKEKYQYEERIRSTSADYEAILRDLKRQLQDKQDDIDKTK